MIPKNKIEKPDDCWNECAQDEECSAATYDKACLLFNDLLNNATFQIGSTLYIKSNSKNDFKNKLVNCKLSEWTEWSGCKNNSKIKNEMTRTRKVLENPQFGGKKCESLKSIESVLNKLDDSTIQSSHTLFFLCFII